MDYKERSIEEHRRRKGKLEIRSKFPLESKDDLSIAYTPGVAGPALAIHKDPIRAYELTSMKNGVAVITDGSAVLGLGDIGPEASLPVMEGKALLFKKFADIDAFPIALSVREINEIIDAIKAIAPTFGGINLEDIGAPRCFEIEERLSNELAIPVFHDDQHGIAIVVLAGLMNSLKIIKKKKEDTRIVINGAGAAGTGITRLLSKWGVRHIVLLDTKGVISEVRNDLAPYKKQLLPLLDKSIKKGTLSEVLAGADVFIGVSVGGLLRAEDIRKMDARAIVFALANPDPEIMPDEAIKGGAYIIATGRSDFPNQLNNALVFPGLFKGLLRGRIFRIADEMKVRVAEALAGMVEPSKDKILPGIFDEGVAETVAKAIEKV